MTKPFTKRDMLAYANFVAPAFGREAPDIPKARAKSRDLEHKEQATLIRWWSLQHKFYGLPEWVLAAIPNGGHRHMITAVRLKAEGVRPGIPDLILLAPRHGFHCALIEMKSEKGVESEDQKKIRNHLYKEGFCSVVCYGSKEAIRFVQYYLGER